MKTTIQNSLRIEGPLSGLLNSQVTDQMSFLSLAKMIAEQASNPNGDKNIKALKHALSAKGALGKIARGGGL